MLTVAVVDDEWLSVECLADMLKMYHRCPFLTRCFTDAGAALDHFRSEKPDILFVDIKMPQMDGFELIRQITVNINPNVVPVIVSGYSDIQYFHNAFHHDVISYILKPVKQDEFFSSLDCAIDKYNRIICERKHADCFMQTEKRKLFDQLTNKGAVDLQQIDPCVHDFGHDLIENLNKTDFRIVSLHLHDSANHDMTGLQSGLSLLPYKCAKAVLFVKSNTRMDYLLLNPIQHDYPVSTTIFDKLKDIFLRIGVSSIGHGTEQMPQKLNESLIACHFALYSDQIINEYTDPQKHSNYYSASNVYEQQLNTVINACLLNKSQYYDLAAYLLDSKLYRSYWDYLRNLEQLILSFCLLIKNHSLTIAPMFLDNLLNSSTDQAALANAVIHWLIQIKDALDEARQPVCKANLNRTIEYIDRNYTKDITLDFLANMAKAGRSYYCSLFKQQTGKTPVEYITEKRVCYASKLLGEGKLKINEISTICGYTDPYYFYKIFKKQTGLTPGEHIRQAQAGKLSST